MGRIELVNIGLILLSGVILVNGQDEVDLEEDIGIIVGIGLLLSFCFCTSLVLICVYCCGVCNKKDSGSKNILAPASIATEVNAYTSPVDVNPTFTVPQSKAATTPVYQPITVSPDELSNDLSSSEKASRDLKKSNLVRKANETVKKVALPTKSRKEKGLSFGRLDKQSQDRVRSVKLMAANGGFNPILPSSKYRENVVENEEIEVRKPKEKEEIKRKVEKLAKGAGGGIYNTGASTARLSMDIVKGFDLMREKKKMEQEIAEKEANKSQNSRVKREVKNKTKEIEVKKKQELPPGSAKLQQFLTKTDEDLDDNDF